MPDGSPGPPGSTAWRPQWRLVSRGGAQAGLLGSQQPLVRAWASKRPPEVGGGHSVPGTRDIPVTRARGSRQRLAPSPLRRVRWQQTHVCPRRPPPPAPWPHPGLVPVCLPAIAHGDNSGGDGWPVSSPVIQAAPGEM